MTENRPRHEPDQNLGASGDGGEPAKPVEPHRGHAEEAFGAWLRRQRELRQISLREIADSSKISLRYLEAFENERFDLLPAEVFAKGFLRQYSRYVGLDPEEAVNFYLAAIADEEPDDPIGMPEPPQPMATRSYLLAAVVAALALLMVVWALTRFGRLDREPPRPVQPPGESAPASPAVVPLAEPDEPPAEPTVVSPLAVTVDFRGECWIEATVDGERRIAETRTQGESVRLEAEGLVELKLGDPTMVDVEVNGRPLALEEDLSRPLRLRVDLETARALATADGSSGERSDS